MLHVTGEYGASCRPIYEGKQQTANEKDPSAALGMTKRGNASLPFLFNPQGKPTSAPSDHLLPEEGGRRGKNPSTPFLWKGDARRAGGWPKGKRAKPASAPSAAFFQRKEGESRLPVSSFRAKARNLFRSRSSNSCEESGSREAPQSLRLHPA